MRKTIQNTIIFVISTLIGVIMILRLYRGFDLKGLSLFFHQGSNYVWITLTILAGIAANVLRALRWRMLLASADIKVSKQRSIQLIFIAYLINSVTPRLGELARSLMVRRGDSAASTRAIGTVVVEKLADVGCLLLLVGLAIGLRWTKSVELIISLNHRLAEALPRASLWVAVGLLCCVAFGLSFPLRRHIKGICTNLWHGMAAIAHLERVDLFLGLCLGIWVCNFLQLYLLVPCFEGLADLGLTDIIHLFAAVSIGLLLPTPAGAGPWHYAVVKMLTTVYYVPKVTAQSFALITHGIRTALVMLLGIMGFMSYYSYTWHRWRRREK